MRRRASGCNSCLDPTPAKGQRELARRSVKPRAVSWCCGDELRASAIDCLGFARQLRGDPSGLPAAIRDGRSRTPHTVVSMSDRRRAWRGPFHGPGRELCAPSVETGQRPFSRQRRWLARLLAGGCTAVQSAAKALWAEILGDCENLQRSRGVYNQGRPSQTARHLHDINVGD